MESENKGFRCMNGFRSITRRTRIPVPVRIINGLRESVILTNTCILQEIFEQELSKLMEKHWL